MKHIKEYLLFQTQSEKPEISLIEEEDVPVVAEILHRTFGNIDSKEEILRKLRPRMTNGLSLKIKVGKKIIGCYLLNSKSINSFLQDIAEDRLKDFRRDLTRINLSSEVSDLGLQGIALCVLPEWRSLGYGEMLKDFYSQDPRFDYIWGVQDKRLGNIEHWKKSREIFAESPTHFATFKIF